MKETKTPEHRSDAIVRVDYAPTDALEPGKVARDRELLPEGFELIAISMVYRKKADCQEEAWVDAMNGHAAMKPLLQRGECLSLRREVQKTPLQNNKEYEDHS